MEVNDILHEDISKLNDLFIPDCFEGSVADLRAMQAALAKIVDALGEQSAAAQGLNRIITTADKLRASPTHTLYLLKDATAKNGKGEVIGLLKVGYKHLFLFDERDHVHEVEPLCVLDFYIVRDRQRSGYGRVLFDYMLHDMEMHAHQLAIDGPSAKMEQFLAKNYEVERLLRQNNNFAVAPQFFERFADISTPAVAAAVGRFAAPKPHSAIANVIHGGASYYAENNGDSSGREYERESEEESSAPPSDEERLPEPLPWAPPAPELDDGPNWDDDDYQPEVACKPPSPERPSTLPVEPEAGAPPAAPAAFADVPAAGLPSGASTPASGSGAAGAARRDSQLTDKGYFDVKFYHNRLW
ncbi:alpha-tubulin N-acetyltransferase-like isoform X2 [Anticarsia gemmatalis]|uniref:alpha-tubulin N-acetyltransferase-like isoform X2 n=1 Tax=Anticarsia gemmatalis TaxID=129554 RepID=UPI003F766F20